MTENIHLTNYCPNGCEPMKSIMHLSEEEAFVMAKKLSSQADCSGFRRFGKDFSEYYPYRIKIENWLYKSFVNVGGKPEIKSPYYFVLEESQFFDNVFGNGIATKIRLSDIEPEHVSFTFGDSMTRFESNDTKPLLMLSDLTELLKKQSVSQFLSSINEQYKIIEAQLWSNKYHDKMFTVNNYELDKYAR